MNFSSIPIRGNRTFAVCAVIVILALCQKYLGLIIPQETWIAVFGVAIACLRAGIKERSNGK